MTKDAHDHSMYVDGCSAMHERALIEEQAKVLGPKCKQGGYAIEHFVVHAGYEPLHLRYRAITDPQTHDCPITEDYKAWRASR